MIQKIIKNSVENNKIIKNNKEIVYMHNLIYILKSIKNKIIALYYNLFLYRYLETKKTAEKIV